ncbi:MAG TPA: BREX system ATP-binding domain-containing protein [bacterium]
MSEKNSSRHVVAHNIFGEGLVLETRWDGVQSRVKFRSGLCLWLPTKWLKPLSITNKDIQLDEISSKRILEAFRMGVVPHQDIEYFTFGRDIELRTLQRHLDDLKQGQGDLCMIEGVYGAGKSHLLEFIRHQALRQGLVTTICELHVQETPPYRPKKVYHELVYNLRYIKDGYERGFRDLLAELASVEINDHCFLTPVLKRVRDMEGDDAGVKNEVFWQWIEGESTKNYATDRSAPFRVRGGQVIPALYDFSTAADFYCYILSGLSYAIHAAGLGGLVIIIDEAEEINHVWEYYLKERGMNFLQGLIGVARNDAQLKKVNGNLIHNQVRPTPYLYKDAHLFLVLATTPQEPNRLAQGAGPGNIIQLRKFSRLECELLFDNLLKVYQCAYRAFKIDPPTSDSILNSALKINKEELREFIKFSVEAFDWVRFNKDTQKPQK